MRRERRWWRDGALVAGVDEVGRGAWAGPVTVGAVVLDPRRLPKGVRDSKLLTPPAREDAAAAVQARAADVAVGHASNDEIDAQGLSAALSLAARRAIEALAARPDVCLLDGRWDFLAGFGTHNEPVVGGDALSLSVAAASVVAKVTRDELLAERCPEYPAYGFSRNKGYPSPEHRAAIAAHGPCLLHRVSWAPFR